MGTTVVVTTRASQDLNEIVDYVAKDNPAAAEKLSEQLLRSAMALGDASLLGCRIKTFPSVRMMVHRRYLILYKFEPTEKRVLILRFWHSARDIGKLRLK
jgi:toxin ParE1/3/4